MKCNLAHGYGWWADEQPSEEIKRYVERQIKDKPIDVILSHTCPFRYEPVEVFLPGIDQSTVDTSTEEWLDAIEACVDYLAWFCGLWHINKRIDKMHFLFHLQGYSEIIRTFAEIYRLPPVWSKNRSECVMALFDEPIFGKAIRGAEPPAGLRAYDLSLPNGIQPVLERHSQHPMRPYFRIPEQTCAHIRALAERANALIQKLDKGVIRDQLSYQAETFLLMTDKLAMSRKLLRRFAAGGLTVRELVLLEDEVRLMIRRYVRLQMEFIRLWLQIAKPSEIDISMTYFAHIIERLDYLRDWLSLKRETLSAGGTITEDFSDYETAGYGTLPTY